MYEMQDVRTKLDGLAIEPVCYYRQGKGMCTGVVMEWVRRILVGDKNINPQSSLYPKMMIDQDQDFFKENKIKILEKSKKKDDKREHAQKIIYDRSRSAFDSDFQTNGARHPCLSEWIALTAEWKGASGKGDPNQRYIVKGKITLWAQKYNITAAPEGVDPKVIEKYLAEANRDAYDHDYWEWRKTEPIEVGIFKEYSEEVERMYFDDVGIALRARFSGMKVIESANSLKIQTRTSWEAVQQAIRNQQFTEDRGIVFGILGKDIAHSLGLYHVGKQEYFWMDPNYGVWFMEQPGIVDAMKYLFDATGKPGEAGVYQENGGGTPTGFEYSVWGANS
ncbi:hypothetical protein R69927_02275 [Paraburkholderia domus]|uniref:hypothetical protein n=1 Tax=Paraburkholderia domus TaxID=2793075 RepID=UPI0019117840|nr:hypothetical protein [Paraburkholderia domus]MBK5061891.1 hypothetical protein [Burkholderia sp. R-70199]MBK5087144.1 hypothetical protein [Burkholderia sp. R-69927]MBK5180920.1 hypothetical protein [Burkholderia sp. R-69749]CAE6734294.1 hypothetical protein R75483_02357 [Paraburkholderia domus]CAE6808170.1 hypothetical protein R69749_02950 [Paraburkholderia domus]